MNCFSEDAFGVLRLAASMIVRDLLEAWTPERKAQIIQSMRERKAELISHEQIGDYDLTLWHYTQFGYYAAALNSGQEDPTTVHGQLTAPKSQRLQWRNVVAVLRGWTRQYGKILIGSADVDRIGQYKRMLQPYFLIGEWSQGIGFFVLPD